MSQHDNTSNLSHHHEQIDTSNEDVHLNPLKENHQDSLEEHEVQTQTQVSLRDDDDDDEVPVEVGGVVHHDPTMHELGVPEDNGTSGQGMTELSPAGEDQRELHEVNLPPVTHITVPTEEGPVSALRPITVPATKKRKRLKKPTRFEGERETGKIYNIDGIPRKWDGKRFRTMCFVPGCTKHASGSSFRCIHHGGGNRCEYENCQKSALGTTKMCGNHGGGIRCAIGGCTSIAVGKQGVCVTHGGGKRCSQYSCTKAARGPTKFCKLHGGG